MTKKKESRLKTLLSALHMTQAELARAANISEGSISLVKSGARPISKGMAAQIAAATGARVEWLLTGDGDMFDESVDVSAYEAARAAGASRFVASIFDRYMALGERERAAFEAVASALLDGAVRDRAAKIIRDGFTINNVIDGDHNNVTNRVGD